MLPHQEVELLNQQLDSRNHNCLKEQHISKKILRIKRGRVIIFYPELLPAPKQTASLVFCIPT